MKWDVPEGVPYNLPETIEARKSFIASEIEAAEREALNRNAFYTAEKKKWHLDGFERGYAEGFEAAREKAAKIIEGECSIGEFFNDAALAYRKRLADRIRQMEEP